MQKLPRHHSCSIPFNAFQNNPPIEPYVLIKPIRKWRIWCWGLLTDRTQGKDTCHYTCVYSLFQCYVCDITIYVKFITSFHHNKPNPHNTTKEPKQLAYFYLHLVKLAYLNVKVLEQTTTKKKWNRKLGVFTCTCINLKMGSVIVWILRDVID